MYIQTIDNKNKRLKVANMEQHGKEPDNIEKNFKILRKCQSKLDCLISEMLFIRLLKPKLNKQSDSLRAKLFV